MTVGPDFETPQISWDESVATARLASLNSSASTEADGQWWHQFNDPALDALIEAAIADNRNLKVAGLRVLEARAVLASAHASLSPQKITTTAAAGYGANAAGGVPIGNADFTYANAGIDSARELDIWGRFRRSVEVADANYLASQANFEDFGLILRAETARAYFGYRTVEAQLRITRENAALQKRSVDISETLFRNGAEDELDVLQARTQYQATIAAIPDLESSLVQSRNALSVLLGRPPGDIPELALGPGGFPVLPATVDTNLPADLLRRRPDVRVAALRAAAQSAQIGIAESELYPSLALVGSVGVTGTSLGGASNVVSLGLGPALSWNIFDFGRIRNNVRVQDARLEQALEAYQETVIQAAREVDSAAIAFIKSQEQNALLAEAEKVARRSLDIAQKGYLEGFSDFDRVLRAQSALIAAQQQYNANRGRNASDLVALYKAIGGGWIAVKERDYASPETRARMKARSNWGDLIDAPSSQQEPSSQ
jgi:NodT family efflux transporter outer membrane factor (OMF) lipoprotein